MSLELQKFTRDEVSRHDSEHDCWVIIDGEVFDVTDFLILHPGGKYVLVECAGKDATDAFYQMHLTRVLDKYRNKLLKGHVIDYVRPDRIGLQKQVPHSEMKVFQGWHSKYWTPEMLTFLQNVQQWYKEEIVPIEFEVERKNKIPKPLVKKLGQSGILCCVTGDYPWPVQYQPTTFLGVDPSSWNIWMEWAFTEGIIANGGSSWLTNHMAGCAIGLPPVKYCQPHIRDRVYTEVLNGDKRICLCISEAFAGSDVANIQTVAKKSQCGKYYIVNGTKKWITSGFKADYFTTAVRTGGKGMRGISMLLIPKVKGVKTRKLTVQTPASETAYIEFDNVQVPVENLIGVENQGFGVIMRNFNHERWAMVCQTLRYMRNCVGDCFLWANQRKVFGKKLIEAPVIRAKLADMVARMEADYAWCEVITHQMNTMPKREVAKHVAGPIALLKYKSTADLEHIILESVQIFGGRGMTSSGMGYRIYRAQQIMKQLSVTGGSMEIMADLGMRQALKGFPLEARL